ncbi:MAG: helix-turn-helix domain-containing protein [Burkholderiales bacterium]|nr:helix-turn-helix domain-containing protein [Burkholderiales bacterium]
MSSLVRMLSVLDLFTEAEPAWTPDAIAQRLACSLPTTYRYVRALIQAGLLRRAAAGTYVLGTRLAELDFQMRRTDPLLRDGDGALRALCEDTGCDVVVAEVLGDRLITVQQLHGSEGVSASFGRGRRMPPFRGMLSKTLLAGLTRPALRRLHAAHAAEAAAEPFAADFDTLVANLRRIRADGYAVSVGELDPGLAGIAVPLPRPGDGGTAALGVILAKRRFSTTDVDAMVRRLRRAAEDVVREVEARAAG